jgi:predicted GNAT family acetyltransferase
VILVKAHAQLNRHAPAHTTTMIKMLTGTLLHAINGMFDGNKLLRKSRIIAQCEVDLHFVEQILRKHYYSNTAQSLTQQVYDKLQQGITTTITTTPTSTYYVLLTPATVL